MKSRIRSFINPSWINNITVNHIKVSLIRQLQICNMEALQYFIKTISTHRTTKTISPHRTIRLLLPVKSATWNTVVTWHHQIYNEWFLFITCQRKAMVTSLNSILTVDFTRWSMALLYLRKIQWSHRAFVEDQHLALCMVTKEHILFLWYFASSIVWASYISTFSSALSCSSDNPIITKAIYCDEGRLDVYMFLFTKIFIRHSTKHLYAKCIDRVLLFHFSW